MTDRLPQGNDKVQAVRSMFDTIAPKYERVNRYISLGLDGRWRRTAVRALALPAPSTVVDLASGTGDFCRLLEAEGHVAVGVDLSFGMLENARTKAPLVQADVLRLPVSDGSVDGATCGFALRNLVALPPFLAELARVVRPGGRVALLDAAVPESPIVRLGHGLWFGHVVPRIGGALSDRSAYRYLPKSLAYLPPAHELLSMIEEAGFTDVRRRSLALGVAQLITATRR